MEEFIASLQSEISSHLNQIALGNMFSYQKLQYLITDFFPICPKRIKESNKLFIKKRVEESALHDNNDYSLALLGTLYTGYGNVISRNMPRAYKYLIKSAKNNNTLGLAELADTVRRDENESNRIEKALNLLEHAIEIDNNAYAYWILGSIYAFSFSDWREGERNFIESVRRGFSHANGNLALIQFKNKNYAKGYEYLFKFPEIYDENKSLLLGMCYEYGYADVEINYINALKEYLIASILGSVRATSAIARFRNSRNTSIAELTGEIETSFYKKIKKYLQVDHGDGLKPIYPEDIFGELTDKFNALSKLDFRETIEPDFLNIINKFQAEISKSAPVLKNMSSDDELLIDNLFRPVIVEQLKRYNFINQESTNNALEMQYTPLTDITSFSEFTFDDNSRYALFELLDVGIRAFGSLMPRLDQIEVIFLYFSDYLARCSLSLEVKFNKEYLTKVLRKKMGYKDFVAKQSLDNNYLDSQYQSFLFKRAINYISAYKVEQSLKKHRADNYPEEYHLYLQSLCYGIKERTNSLKADNVDDYIKQLEAISKVIISAVWTVACLRYIDGAKEQLSVQYNLMNATKTNIDNVVKYIVLEGFPKIAKLYLEVNYELSAIRSGSARITRQ